MSFIGIMDNFEEFLKSHDTRIMQSFHPHFERAFWEMVLNGGKRFRPQLMLAIIAGNRAKKLRDSFEIALAIEVLHTYSLIHDDLPAMDNANLRRNHKTLHIKYDEASAILCGDGLNSYAFYLISNSNFSPKIKNKLIKSLGFGSLKMVLGQACDCFFEHQTLEKEKLLFIHENKTARLIASALEMGAIIAKLPKKTRKKLYAFGMNLGLFFQIRDDILDSTQSSKTAGKTTKNDTNKNSYVNLLGLKDAKNELEIQKCKILRELNEFAPKIRLNLQIMLKKYLEESL